jgi:adenosylmethionine-8-amino-7-oxononanoate aminotransferase
MNDFSTKLTFSQEDYLSSDRLGHMVLDFVQMQDFMQAPLVFERSEGVWVWDVKGEKYLDGISGVWVVGLGHGNQRIVDAVKRQLDMLAFCSPILSTNTKAVELVDLLGKITPSGLTTIKLLSGGSEAVETAIKLVRQYFQQTGRPNKQTIISRYLNFHGTTMGALTATGIASRKWKFEPLCGGFRHVAPPYCFRCPYKLRYPDCDILCARFVEQIIKFEDPDTVAAFIGEPIQLSAGNLVPPPEYWPVIRDICDKYDVMLILDEIITGFGRTGEMWGADTFHVIPDLLCMGKGMSSGYAPLAGVAFRDEMGKAFFGEGHERAFADGHTYAGNPVSSAAGIASIQELLKRNLAKRSFDMGQYLQGRLNEIKDLGVIGDIRGKGLMIGVEFVQDCNSRKPFPEEIDFGTRVGKNCIHKQKLLVRSAPNWIAVAPPFTVGEEEIDMIVRRISLAIKEELVELKE